MEFPSRSPLIDEFVASAKELGPFTRKVKRGGDFLAEYVPITYSIDGVLPCGSIYMLTGKTGHGKTSFAQALALSAVSGRNLIGFDVEPGRVAYIVLENPADFRMKLAVNSYIHGIDHRQLNKGLAIIDMHLPHAEIMEQLRIDGEENGPFCLVFYDTFQSGFPGAQFNDNVDVLRHTQQLRELTALPGAPGVLVPAHPVKNAGKDSLLPYGGGATINEVDGNLTLWAENGLIEFTWTKVRGPQFEPRSFKIEQLGCPEILDSKNRTPLLPVMRAVSQEGVEQKERAAAETAQALLRIIAADPNGTQRDWAAKLKTPVGSMTRFLNKLKSEGLAEDLAGKWSLTAKGKRAIRST
jgi:AAA domain